MTMRQKWVLSTVGDVGNYINGLAFKPADWGLSGRRIIRIQNLTNPSKPFNYTDKEVDPKYLVEDGNILVSWSATLDAFIWKGPESVLNQHIFRVLPNREKVTNGFLFYQLKHVIQEMRRGEHTHGSTMLHINRGPFLAHPFWVPPLDVQRKVVSAIEAHFSRLDVTIGLLERVKARLAHGRASVLKAAVEGRLVPTETALLRSEGRFYEHGSTLLARILTERRARAIDDEARGTYKEPVAADLDGVGPLPLGWAWGSCDQVGEILLGRRRAPEYTGEERLYLRVANVKDGLLDLGDVQRMPFEDGEFEKYQLKTGDVLVSEGQSPELVGQSALYLGAPNPCAFQATLHRFRPDSTSVLPRYAETVFRAWVRGGVFRKRCIVTTNIGHLTLGRFKSVPFPLPPLAEQHRIVAEVDRRLSVLDAIEVTVNADLARCARLRQSILKRAFEGRLVRPEPVIAGEQQLLLSPQDAAR